MALGGSQRLRSRAITLLAPGVLGSMKYTWCTPVHAHMTQAHRNIFMAEAQPGVAWVQATCGDVAVCLTACL